MRHILICGLPVSTLFFPRLSHKRYDFRKEKKWLNIKYVLLFSVQILSKTFLILRRTERDTINMYVGLHVKWPSFLFECNESWIFSTYFRKIIKYRISWKSVPCESSCSMRTDGHDDANRRFSQFCEKRLKHFSVALLCWHLSNDREWRVGTENNINKVAFRCDAGVWVDRGRSVLTVEKAGSCEALTRIYQNERCLKMIWKNEMFPFNVPPEPGFTLCFISLNPKRSTELDVRNKSNTKLNTSLTFMWPCIVINSYNTSK